MATIYDIARVLGISASTVSRALNGSRLVKDEVRESVERVAAEIGYRKRLIRRHRARVILNVRLLLPSYVDAERALFFDFAQLVDGLKRGLSPCVVNLVCDVNRPDFDPFPHKKGGDIDAFVFAFCEPSPEVLRAIKARNVPVALLNRIIDGVACVVSDPNDGMGKLVAHLLAGMKELRPKFLSLKGMDGVAASRLGGFADACAAHGVAFDRVADVVEFASIDEVSRKRMSEVAKGANAMICVNDILAAVVLSELDRSGIKVPDDVVVAGFDASPLRRLTRPLLTTVALPVHDLARFAGVRLQAEIVENEEPTPLLRVAGDLVIGDSTRPVT